MSEPQESQLLDENQVRHVAKLARLDLANADVSLLSRQISSILNYVRQIQEPSVEGLEPLAHPLSLENVLRVSSRRWTISLPPRQPLFHQAAFDGLGGSPDTHWFAIHQNPHFLKVWLKFSGTTSGNLDSNATQIFGFAAVGALATYPGLAGGVMTNMRHFCNS